MRAILALSLAAALLLAACGGDDAPESSPTPAATPVADTITIPGGQPITIGVSAALSGTQVNLGLDIADAADMAAAEFGAIEGHPVVVKRVDDGCIDAEAAVEVAHTLIDEETLAGVIGPMCTTGAQAANIVYERARAVHIAVSATRVELSAQGERHFFRVSWRDDAQARLLAAYTYTSGAATALVVDDGDPYGRGLADAFTNEFEALGGRVVANERIERGETDFTGIAAQAPDAAAVVYAGLNPEGALLVKELRRSLYTGAFVGPDGLLSYRDFIGVAATSAEQAVISGGAMPDEAFNARFNQRLQRLPNTPFVLQSHDGVTALLTAIRSVATSGADGALTIDRDALVEELRAQQFAGLTGMVSFDEQGDRAGATAGELGLRIYRVVNSVFEPIN